MKPPAQPGARAGPAATTVRPSDLFCTTIIPTIGRDSLGQAVESVLNQKVDRLFEVLVVNDSGRPLAAEAWQNDARVRVIGTQRRERCVARNTGAALAGGRYLHFLDDDDWLLPDALTVFSELAQTNTAAWLYGATQLVDAAGQCLFQFDHQLSGNCLTPVLTGEWVPLQASLIDAAAFFDVGGFDASLASVEDKDLLARMAARYDLGGTAIAVAAIRRGTWASSTDWNSVAQNVLRAREPVLDQPGVYKRMRASAGSSYWQGRLFRTYLISVVWNWQHGNAARVFSRCLRAAACLALAGPRLLARDYWWAVSHRHLTRGFVPAGGPPG